MTLIIIAGLIRSGKDAAAEYIRDKYNYQLLIASDIIKEEAMKRGIQPTKNNLTSLTKHLLDTGFQGFIAKRLLEKFEKGNIVISAFRDPVQVDYMRNEYDGKVYVLEVFAKSEIRFGRRKETDPKTEEEFFFRDDVDVNEFGLNKVLELADFRITNNGSLEEMYEQVDEIMKEIE